MSTCTLPELESFSDWIQATDDHAEHHLTLLARVERALASPAAVSAAERASLAQKVERWRYQHLNEHAGALSAENEAWIDALDIAARQLARARPSPASPYAARGVRSESRYGLDPASSRCT